MKSYIALIMVVSTLTAVNANPIKRLVINFKKKTYSQESVLNLKKEIKKKYPNINFDKYDLKNVVLNAKSARGYGQAYLKIGRYESRIETIDGSRFEFHRPRHFHTIRFESPGRRDKGVWQIHMKGKVKVKNVVLFAQKKQQAPRVSRECKFQLETIWGKDIKRFTAHASGPRGSGVQANACQAALNKCHAFSSEIPLTKCTKV